MKRLKIWIQRPDETQRIEVHEIRRNREFNLDEEGLPDFRSFGEEASPTERVTRFTFTFKEGKIFTIERPTIYTKCVKKFQELN
jgi:hypothetical protein